MKIIKNLLFITVGIICILVSIAGYKFPQAYAEENSKKLIETSIDAFSVGLKERIISAKSQMQILSKHNGVSGMKRINYVLSILKSYKNYLKSILFSSDLDALIIAFNEYVIDCKDKFNYVKEIPAALERLFYYIISFGKSFDDEDDYKDETNRPKPDHSLRFVGSNFLHYYNYTISSFLDNLFGGLEAIANFGGQIGLLKRMVPAEPIKSLAIMSLALDSGRIKKLIMRNANYDIVLSAGYEKFPYISNHDIDKVEKGSIFSNGGIVYSDSGIPYWQLTVPVRDIDYKTNFYMTAFVEIADLFEFKEKNFKLSLFDNFGNEAGESFQIQENWKKKLIDYSSSISYLSGTRKDINLIVGKGFKCGSENFSNDFYIFVKLVLFMYLNEWYYPCILGLIVLFLTGVTLILNGVFTLTNSVFVKANIK